MNRINQLLNISYQEWPRILVSWTSLFLFRFGFIVGWTVLLASFLGEYGIKSLPLLFLSNAVLVMIGALIFRPLAQRINRATLISICILAGSAFLLTGLFLSQESLFLFFLLVFIAESVFFAQVSILLSLFTEELFSPLESQRTFPVIESAETIGGILGGLALTVLLPELAPFKFFAIWVIALILMIPIVLKFNRKTMAVPELQSREESNEPDVPFMEQWRNIQKLPFLKGLSLLIVLQWGVMNILEFQYTAAIQESVANSSAVILADINSTAATELGFAHDLALLHVVFNTGALLIHLFFASRILVALGVSSSLFLHPMVTLLNLIGMTFRFGFFTAAITRGSFELTQHIFKNAYNSSYYTIPHKTRVQVKEIFEGLMKPFGALIGTGFIVLCTSQIPTLYERTSLNFLLIAMTLGMGFICLRLFKSYTDLTEQNLSRKNDLATRLSAVEILGQNGHERWTPSLEKILKRPDEPLILKEAILKTLGFREKLESIETLISLLHSSDKKIRYGAAKALESYKKLNHEKMDNAFTRFRVLEEIKSVLTDEKEEDIREILFKIYYRLAPVDATEQLIEKIKITSDHQASLIRVLKLFEDPNLIHYLRPFLKNSKPSLRGASIEALWKFKEIRSELEHYLGQMLNGAKKEMLLEAIRCSGVVQWKESKVRLLEFLKAEDKEIRDAAVLALAHMEIEEVIPHMIKNFTEKEHIWFEKMENILERLPQAFQEKVQSALHIHISTLIHGILKQKSVRFLEELGCETLETLKGLYQKIGAASEINKIEMALAPSEEEKT